MTLVEHLVQLGQLIQIPLIVGDHLSCPSEPLYSLCYFRRFTISG